MTKNKKKLRRAEKRYSVTKSAQTLVLAGMLLAGGVSGAMAATNWDTPGAWTGEVVITDAKSPTANAATFPESIGVNGFGQNITATKITLSSGSLTLDDRERLIGRDQNMVFDMTGGTLTITSGSTTGGYANSSLDAGTVTISDGTVALTGTANARWQDAAYVGGYKGLTVTAGTITMNENSELFGGGTVGAQLKGGTIKMLGTASTSLSTGDFGGNAAHIMFGGTGANAIDGASIVVGDASNSDSTANYGVMSLGAKTEMKSGSITVNKSAHLMLQPNAGTTGIGYTGTDFTTFEMTDGTLTVEKDGTLYAPQVAFTQDGGTVTVHGAFNGASPADPFNYSEPKNSKSSYTMTDGDFEVSGVFSSVQVGKLSIKGGDVTVKDNGDTITNWHGNGPTLGGYGAGDNITEITGNTAQVTLGDRGVFFAAVNGKANAGSWANGQLNISNGAKLFFDGDTSGNKGGILYAASSNISDPAKDEKGNYAVALNISGTGTTVTVNSSKEGYILARETNLSGGALLDVKGNLVVAGKAHKTNETTAAILDDIKKTVAGFTQGGVFNVNTGGTVTVDAAGKVDFATGEVDLNVNGGKVTATGLNVGTVAENTVASVTAGWVNAEKVTTTGLNLSGSGTGAGINVSNVDIASGGYLKIAGNHTMAGSELTDNTAASTDNNISVANGGTFKVDTLTLTGGANVASGVTVGGTVEVDAINATNNGAATALEWNKGTLKIMGVTGAGAFSNATSLGVTGNGTVMLGDAGDVADSAGGSYAGAVTVGSGGTLKVEAGDWTLSNAAGVTSNAASGLSVTGGTLNVSKLTTGNASGVSITGGKLVVGSGTAAGSLTATTVGTDKVVVNGVNAVLEAAWGDVIATDGYQNGILTGTKGTLMLRKDGNYKLSDLDKASKYNASSVSGLLVGINTTGKLVDDNNNAVTELDNTQAGTVQGALFDVSVKPTGNTNVALGSGTVAQTVAFKDIDLSNGSGVSIGNNSNVTLIEGISNGAGKTTTLNNATVTLGNTEAGNKNSTITTAIDAANGTSNKLVIATGDHTVLGAVTQTGTGKIDFEIAQGNLITKEVFTANEVAISNGKNLEGEKTITLTTANLNGSAVKTTTNSADIVIETANIGDNGGAVNSGKDLRVGTVNTNNKTTILTAGNDVKLTNGVSTTGGLLIDAGKEIDATGKAISGGMGSSVNTGTLKAAAVTLSSGTFDLTDTGATGSTLSGALNLGSDTGGLSAVAGDVKGKLDLQAGGNLVGGSSLAVNELTIAAAQTLNVGNKEETGSTGALSVTKLANGGTIFADPAWIDGAAHDTSYASQVAIEGFATAGQLTSNIVGGQASQIVIGSADTAWVKDKLDKYNAEYQTNIWGGNGAGQVTAALGIAKAVTLDANNKLHIDGASTTVATSGTNNTASFGANSLLIVDAKGVGAANTALTAGIIDVAANAKLMVSNTTVGSTYKVATAGAGALDIDATSWRDGNLLTDHRLLAGTLTVDAANTNATVTINQRSAASALPGLSGEMGGLIDQMVKQNLTSENSSHAGVRFANRAINRLNGEQAAATIEGAAQLAVVGAAPAMTLSAVQAGTSTVTTRTSFASPLLDSSKAVALHKDVDGTLSVDSGLSAGNGMKNGFGLWIMPLYQSNSAWGMKADGFKGGYKSDLGGVALGADYTFNDMFRLGLAFNIGGGYAESNGDFNKTENSFNFWGINAYGGWTMNNFGITADVGYTGNYNKLQQELPGAMGMGDIKSDVNSSAWTAGLRGEYKFATEALDIIPHVGVRYTGLTTDEYKAKSSGDTVFKVDQDFQSIWTFPIGVTLAKEIETGSGWIIRPQVDLGITPATGDVKAKSKVRIPGVDSSAEMKMQVVDYMSYDGGVGLEMKKDNISFGVNYNIQASEHRTGHGVFGTFRYEF